MKSVDNIYNGVTDVVNIMDVYNKTVRKNTKNKRRVERFDNDYVKNICYIKNVLDSHSYIPSKYHIFVIHEPKVRLVMSQNMIDKLINHIVCKYFLEDIFESSLIDTNIATRKRKGTHYGINMLTKYLRESKDKYDEFYVLQFDIKKYFFNIDHNILKEILKRKIKDKDALNILFQIIDTTNARYVNEEISKFVRKGFDVPKYLYGKGLPIGNMTSQFLAILYLNELDHMIKEKLKIKYYIRYMDDGILLHPSKEYLRYCLEKIDKMLNDYDLELNSKTKICNSKIGMIFLGYRFIFTKNKLHIRVRKETMNRFKNKVKYFKKIKNDKKLEIIKTSYHGYFKYTK